MKLEPRADSEVRCALCHGPLGKRAWVCSSCRTRLHEECRLTATRCPTLGCTGPIEVTVVPRRGRFGRALVAIGVTILVLFIVPIGIVGFVSVSGSREVRTPFQVVADPSSSGTKSASDFVTEGRRKAERGDLEGAIHDFTSAIDLEPRYASAWLERCRSRAKAGDVAGALVDSTRATELDPMHGVAWSYRAWARFCSGDVQGAIADYTRALELEPRIASAWAGRGKARAKTGNCEGAKADFERALALDPANAEARAGLQWASLAAADDRTNAEVGRGSAWNLCNLVWEKCTNGDFLGAIPDATRAIELEPTNVNAWVNRGWARASTGDLAGCVADSTRALELDPKNVTAFLNRGWARGRMGDLEGCIADSTRALELDSHAPHARANREWAISQQRHR